MTSLAHGETEPAWLFGQLFYGGLVWVTAPPGTVRGPAVLGMPRLSPFSRWTADAPTGPSLHMPPPAVAGGPDAVAAFTVYRIHRRLAFWAGSTVCALAVVAAALCAVLAAGTGDGNWIAGIVLAGLMIVITGWSALVAARAHLAVSSKGVSLHRGLGREQLVPWEEVEDVTVEQLPPGGDVNIIQYQIVLYTPNGRRPSLAPLDTYPDRVLPALRDRILADRDRVLRRGSSSPDPPTSPPS